MKTKFLNVVLLSLLIALGSGCAAVVVGGAAAGIGALIYKNGNLSSTENVAYENAWRAALLGAQDLQYAVIQQEHDALEGKILARGAADKKIQIWVRKVTGNMSEITVRVGSFGDEQQSVVIMEAIKRRF